MDHDQHPHHPLAQLRLVVRRLGPASIVAHADTGPGGLAASATANGVDARYAWLHLREAVGRALANLRTLAREAGDHVRPAAENAPAHADADLLDHLVDSLRPPEDGELWHLVATRILPDVGTSTGWFNTRLDRRHGPYGGQPHADHLAAGGATPREALTKLLLQAARIPAGDLSKDHPAWCLREAIRDAAEALRDEGHATPEPYVDPDQLVHDAEEAPNASTQETPNTAPDDAAARDVAQPYLQHVKRVHPAPGARSHGPRLSDVTKAARALRVAADRISGVFSRLRDAQRGTPGSGTFDDVLTTTTAWRQDALHAAHELEAVAQGMVAGVVARHGPEPLVLDDDAGVTVAAAIGRLHGAADLVRGLYVALGNPDDGVRFAAAFNLPEWATATRAIAGKAQHALGLGGDVQADLRKTTPPPVEEARLLVDTRKPPANPDGLEARLREARELVQGVHQIVSAAKAGGDPLDWMPPPFDWQDSTKPDELLDDLRELVAGLPSSPDTAFDLVDADHPKSASSYMPRVSAGEPQHELSVRYWRHPDATTWTARACLYDLQPGRIISVASGQSNGASVSGATKVALERLARSLRGMRNVATHRRLVQRLASLAGVKGHAEDEAQRDAEDLAVSLLRSFAKRFTEEPCGGPQTTTWARRLWSMGRQLRGEPVVAEPPVAFEPVHGAPEPDDQRKPSLMERLGRFPCATGPLVHGQDAPVQAKTPIETTPRLLPGDRAVELVIRPHESGDTEALLTVTCLDAAVELRGHVVTRGDNLDKAIDAAFRDVRTSYAGKALALGDFTLLRTLAAIDPTRDTEGLAHIATERRRQIDKGYDLHHDLQHTVGDLAMAALATLDADPERWPFRDGWKERPDRIDRYRVAGAFLAAAIDRELEAAKPKP